MLRIFKLVISIFYSFIIRLRSLLEKLTGRQLPDICVVLYYHAIKPEQRRQFARQMDDLVKRAKTVRAGTGRTWCCSSHRVRSYRIWKPES